MGDFTAVRLVSASCLRYGRSGQPTKPMIRFILPTWSFVVLAVSFLLTSLELSAGQGLPLALPETVGMSSQRLERIRPFVREYVDEGKVAGVVTLVARHGKIVYFDSYGERDEEAQKSMEKDTLVRIYSMTKPIAAVGLMMLHEEGAFQLNEPVSKYLPEFKNLKVLDDGEEVEPRRAMSIQHLLTHTAGLTYGIFGNTPVDKQYRDAGVLGEKNLDEMIDHLADIPLQDHPGEKWHYSVAVDVQGALIERLSGMPLDQFFRERIFEPLGMHDTFFEVPADKVDRFAANYRFSRDRGRRLIDAPGESKFVKEVTFFSAGGGLISTAADYWKFSQMLLNGGYFDGVRLLGRKTVELMTQNHLPALLEEPDPNSTFGFGLGFRVILNVPSTGAPGSEGEYSWGGAAGTIFWIDPKEDLIAVVMIQLMSSPYNLRRELKSLIYQALID